MAKWNIGSATGGSMRGGFEYESGSHKGDSFWQIYQDEKPFVDQAKVDREVMNRLDTGFKKFATIPDIVAIEIMTNHGIDIHNPDHSGDSATMAKFKKIIKQDYPYLLSY